LENGAGCNTISVKMKRTPLHFGAYYGYVDVVRCLLEMGSDPFICDKNNEIAIQICARMCKHQFEELWDSNYLELVRILDESKHMQCILELLTEFPDHIKRAQFARLNRTPKVAYLILYSQISLEQSWGNVRRMRYDFTLIEAPTRREKSVLANYFSESGSLIFSHPLVKALVDLKWESFGDAGFYWELAFDLCRILLVGMICSYYWVYANARTSSWGDEYYAMVSIGEILLAVQAVWKMVLLCPCWTTTQPLFHGTGEEKLAGWLLNVSLLLIAATRFLWLVTDADQVYTLYTIIILVHFVMLWFGLSVYTKFLPGRYSAGTCYNMAGATLQFFWIFIVVLMGFTFAFLCLFGNLEEVENWYETVMWLIVMAVGHLEPIATEIRENREMGVILIFLYTSMMTFLLLTFFTALMDHRFSGEHERQKQAWNYERARRILNIEAQLPDEAFHKFYKSEQNITDEVTTSSANRCCCSCRVSRGDSTSHHVDERQSKMLSYLKWFKVQYEKEVRELDAQIQVLRTKMEAKRARMNPRSFAIPELKSVVEQ